MSERIQNEIKEAVVVGIPGFDVSVDRLIVQETGSTLYVPYQCRTFERTPSFKDWKFFVTSFFVAMQRGLFPRVTDLPVEVIRLLKQYVVTPYFELAVEIQFPQNYPIKEPTFILHNLKNYNLPRNVTAFFAEQKFFGNRFGSAQTLATNYLPLIKEECERKIDEKNDIGECYYRSCCAPHCLKIRMPNKTDFVSRLKKVRYCLRPLNHYKTIMEAIPKEFREKDCHRIILNDRDMKSDEEWRNVYCGSTFDIYLGRDFEWKM
jgi:hypothetical protein